MSAVAVEQGFEPLGCRSFFGVPAVAMDARSLNH